MYVREQGRDSVFDAILAVEGKFHYRPEVDAVPVVEVVLAYANSVTKTTYGSCPFRTFSPKTQEALMHFLECAEQDFGEIVFEGGILTPFGPISASQGAESQTDPSLSLPRG
jgi:hypothetical protein